MLSALPTLWGSLEVPSRPSPTLVVSEVPALSRQHDAGLQYVALSLQEQDIFGSQENLPSIDESLFDLVEVPELEEVDTIDEQICPSASIGPLDDLLLDEIPALEDAFDDKNTLQWEDEEETFKISQQVTNPSSPPAQWETLLPPKVTTPTILIDEPLVEEVVVSESPVSLYVESCGSDSPVSCYSLAASSDDLAPPAEKRRRVSQISMSSYCSSAGGDSLWSPTSTSDSDVESKRGGRRSRFSPQDRKERKKAQNRTAAERYRQKRKIQEETIGEEEQSLIDGNTELKTEVTKLQAEVSCMKRLLREMLLAKGVKIPPRKK